MEKKMNDESSDLLHLPYVVVNMKDMNAEEEWISGIHGMPTLTTLVYRMLDANFRRI